MRIYVHVYDERFVDNRAVVAEVSRRRSVCSERHVSCVYSHNLFLSVFHSRSY